MPGVIGQIAPIFLSTDRILDFGLRRDGCQHGSRIEARAFHKMTNCI
jgi:hypothetical protein